MIAISVSFISGIMVGIGASNFFDFAPPDMALGATSVADIAKAFGLDSTPAPAPAPATKPAIEVQTKTTSVQSIAVPKVENKPVVRCPNCGIVHEETV